MCLHEHVLTVCVPLSCRLAAGIVDGMSSCSKLACELSLELCGGKESPWLSIVRCMSWWCRCLAELQHVFSCFVLQLRLDPCPCRAMSMRVRGACPCTAVVNLRVCM